MWTSRPPASVIPITACSRPTRISLASELPSNRRTPLPARRPPSRNPLALALAEALEVPPLGPRERRTRSGPVATRAPAYLNWTIFARAPWRDWKHARLVTREECLHCGRAIDPAAAWRAAIAVVGPDDRPGPERPLGVLHAACTAPYLAAPIGGADDD